MWLSGLLILSSYDLVFLKDGVSVYLYFVHVSIAVFSSFSTGHKQYLDVPDSRALFINSITDNRFIIGSVFALRNIPLFTFSLMYHHSRVTCILSKHGCMILVTFANHILSWLPPSLNVLVEPFIVGVLRAILNQKMLNTGCSETWQVMFISHQACLQWQEYLWSVVLENLFEFFEFFLTYNCSKTWSCIGSMASVVHNVTSAQNFILNWFNDFFSDRLMVIFLIWWSTTVNHHLQAISIIPTVKRLLQVCFLEFLKAQNRETCSLNRGWKQLVIVFPQHQQAALFGWSWTSAVRDGSCS